MTNTTLAPQIIPTELLKYGPIHLEQALSVEEFTLLYAQFPDLLLEREANGRVSIMSPVKRGSGRRESFVNTLVGYWSRQSNLGETYSPSTGILLPTGAVKSPDCAWVSDEHLATLDKNSDEQFLKVVPDFVVEVRSSTDSLKKLKSKMEETWMENGVRLAWLIDPYSEKVWIYRAGKKTEVIEGFEEKILSGEAVLEGFELPLTRMRLK